MTSTKTQEQFFFLTTNVNIILNVGIEPSTFLLLHSLTPLGHQTYLIFPPRYYLNLKY
jgi:hypothetical protein